MQSAVQGHTRSLSVGGVFSQTQQSAYSPQETGRRRASLDAERAGGVPATGTTTWAAVPHQAPSLLETRRPSSREMNRPISFPPRMRRRSMESLHAGRHASSAVYRNGPELGSTPQYQRQQRPSSASGALSPTSMQIEFVSPESYHHQQQQQAATRDREKRTRQRTTDEQTQVLESTFRQTPLPSVAMRTELAAQLGMSARRIQVWFQNKRAQRRRHQRAIETDLRRQEEVSVGRLQQQLAAHSLNSEDGRPVPPTPARHHPPVPAQRARPAEGENARVLSNGLVSVRLHDDRVPSGSSTPVHSSRMVSVRMAVAPPAPPARRHAPAPLFAIPAQSAGRVQHGSASSSSGQGVGGGHSSVSMDAKPSLPLQSREQQHQQATAAHLRAMHQQSVDVKPSPSFGLGAPLSSAVQPPPSASQAQPLTSAVFGANLSLRCNAPCE